MNVEELKCFAGLFTHPDLRNFDPHWLGKVIEDFDNVLEYEYVHENNGRTYVMMSLRGVKLPSLVKANIEQLASLYAPAIALLTGFDEHCELNDSEINTEDMRLDGYGELCLVGNNSEHHLVCFKHFKGQTYIEFTCNEKALNDWTVTLYKGVLRKALEITRDHMGVIKFGDWSCYDEDLWYYDSYFALREIRNADNYDAKRELRVKFRKHIFEFLSRVVEIDRDDEYYEEGGDDDKD